MANQQLLDYIKKQSKEGVSSGAIKQALAGEGWSKEDVDAGFKELQSLKGKDLFEKNFKTIAIVAGVAVLAALIGAGFYMYQRQPLEDSAGPESVTEGEKIVRSVKESVVKKIASVPGEFNVESGKMIFSHDASKVAFVGFDVKNRTKYVFLNDSKKGPYDDVFSLIFSRDDSKLIYTARRDGKEFVVVNDEEGEKYSRIGTDDGASKAPVISDDGSEIAYVAGKGNGYAVVINGTEGKEYDYIRNLRPIGRGGIAYSARSGKDEFFISDAGIKDAEVGSEFTNYLGGKSTAKITELDGRQIAVVNGKESRPYEKILEQKGRFFVFSRNDRVAYVARDGGQEMAVVDQIEEKAYQKVSGLIFGPDGSLAYIGSIAPAENAVVVNGHETGSRYERVGYLQFNRDNKIFFSAMKNNQWVVFYDNTEGRAYEYVSVPFFDNDGKIMFGVKEGIDFNLMTR